MDASSVLLGEESGSLKSGATASWEVGESAKGADVSSAAAALRAAQLALQAGDGVPRAAKYLEPRPSAAGSAPSFGASAQSSSELRDALRRANNRCEELAAWAEHLEDEVEAERRTTRSVTTQLQSAREAVAAGVRAMVQLDRKPDVGTAEAEESRFARRVAGSDDDASEQDALSGLSTEDLVRKFDDVQRGFFGRLADSLRGYRRRASEEARRTAAQQRRAEEVEAALAEEKAQRKAEVEAMVARLDEYSGLGDENLRLLEQLEHAARERQEAAARHAEFAKRLVHYVQLLQTDVERQLGFVPASRTVGEDGLLELVRMSGLEAAEAQEAREEALKRLKRRRELHAAAATKGGDGTR